MAEKILSEADMTALIAAANQRLKCFGLLLEIRGKKRKLCIRGTFPPKPNSHRDQNYQTRIALQQAAVTRKDIKEAEQVALQIGLDLNAGNFDWRKWSDWADGADGSTSTQKLSGDWAKELEDYYWATREQTPQAKSTWRTNYQLPLKTLPPDQPLSAQFLRDWVMNNSKPGPTRVHYCMTAKALAELAQIDVNLKGLSKIVRKAINPRLIPNDEELLAMRAAIEDPGWQHLCRAC